MLGKKGTDARWKKQNRHSRLKCHHFYIILVTRGALGKLQMLSVFLEQKLTNKLLETHIFLQCIGTIDDSHIEIAELKEHYSDYMKRKG